MSAPKLVYVATSARFWPFLAGQAGYMKACGFDVHAVSAPGRLLDEFAVREGVTAWRIALSRRITPLADLAALCRLWRLFQRLQPALVHAHTPKAGLLAMLAAWLARVPARVYTLHGLACQTERGWRRRLLSGAERLACRLAGLVLAVSHSVRRAALEKDLALTLPEKIVVPREGSANGIDFERFDPDRLACDARAARRRRCGIPPRSLVVGFVGRLVPDKGIAELFAAWRGLRDRFPSLHLVLVGEAEPHDPLPVWLAEALRSDPRVHITGWVSDMPEHYALMDVCVLPSRREGLPYAAIEAAAMEIPVVAFRATGTVDAIEDGSSGLLVPAGDSGALAEAVARLLQNPFLAASLGRQARRRALELYRPEPLWAAIHQQYVTLLAARTAFLWWKRPFDLVAAVAATIALAPLWALLAVAVLIDLGPPVLFRQRRLGRAERPFEILKFRTMREAPQGTPDRERLTRLGRFLRRASLDELPQLINILRGEMSFLGPRPLLERYLGAYTERERRRHLVRPGLTGWAQIHGRNNVAWNERLEFDAWYVDHASFLLDARIALASFFMLFHASGVREDPSASMLDLDQERHRA